MPPPLNGLMPTSRSPFPYRSSRSSSLPYLGDRKIHCSKPCVEATDSVAAPVAGAGLRMAPFGGSSHGAPVHRPGYRRPHRLWCRLPVGESGHRRTDGLGMPRPPLPHLHTPALVAGNAGAVQGVRRGGTWSGWLLIVP